MDDSIRRQATDVPDTNVGDTIYRQAAIDAICDNCDAVKASCPHYPCSRYVAVEKLPPAQPEQSSEIQDILNYLDTVLHPIISPEHWNVYSELHDMISTLPSAQPEPRWIPVSERLPEKVYDHYWVCTDTGYQCQCRWTDDVYGLGSSGEWTWKIFDIPQYSHVVAWMPLPSPYQAERREE